MVYTDFKELSRKGDFLFLLSRLSNSPQYRKVKRSAEVNYLLRKKMHCGLCGKPMSGKNGTEQ